MISSYSSAQALQILKSHHREIDIVLMDIQMPKMRGDDATRLFRSWEADALRPGEKPLLIFACTGNVTSTDIASHVRCGFSGCLSKPLRQSTMETILTGSEEAVQQVLLPSPPSVSSTPHLGASQ